MKNKKLDNIILPKEYNDTINDIILVAKNIYKDNLKAIFLAGSSGKGYVIEGWSDIDLYIITNYFDFNANNIFYKECLNKVIHIGTTFYTLDNVNKLNVDPKTIISIYEYQEYGVNRFIYNSIEFPKINYSYIIEKTANPIINDTIQAVIREYNNYILTKNNFKSLIKKLTVLLKIYLNKNYNTFTFGYKNVFDTYFKITHSKYIDIERIIKNHDDKNEIIEIVQNILCTIMVR